MPRSATSPPTAPAHQGLSIDDWASWDGLQQIPVLKPEAMVPAGHRAVVVAPHPDDEVLGCGGVLHAMSRLPRRILLVALTNGEASHPRSTRYTPNELARTRARESARALSRLGAHCAEVNYFGLPDGHLATHETSMRGRLLELLGPRDVVLCPWLHDGHPDHEAAGRAAQAACRESGARLFGVPVWTCHWAAPGDARVPWSKAVRVPLSAAALVAKREALYEFRSQLEPDPSTGAAPILPPEALARWLHGDEVFFL